MLLWTVGKDPGGSPARKDPAGAGGAAGPRCYHASSRIRLALGRAEDPGGQQDRGLQTSEGCEHWGRKDLIWLEMTGILRAGLME